MQIRPALWRDESTPGRCGGLEIDRIDDVTCLILRYSGHAPVTVRGADDLSRLVAWANDALPDDDPRKITCQDVHLLHALAASIEVQDTDLTRILPLVEAFCKKLRGILFYR